MQPFLERVVGHLERVQRVASKEIVDADVPVDYARFEAFVVRLFDQANGSGTWRWDAWYLHRFVEELHWDLLDGRGGQWTAEGRFQFMELVIRKTSGLPHPNPELGDATIRNAQAMGAAVTSRIGIGSVRGEDAVWQAAPRYCDRLGLTRSASNVTSTAAAGITLLRLRGIDRLRWLLAIETSVASSGLDPWCMDLASARSLSRQREWWIDPREEEPPPANDDAIERWTALGALRDAVTEETAAAQATIFAVTEVGAQLFNELAEGLPTSFHTLARALFEDERDAVLAPPADGPAHDRATAATLRHARMVAHEVRNALLPVQFALDKVWASAAGGMSELDVPRKRIQEGLMRLHRFVDESLRLTPITPEEAVPFSIMDAIEEARRQCNPAPEGGFAIEAHPGSANPRCRGHRGRFVLALLNLMRNAVQAGGIRIRVKLIVDSSIPGRVIVTVEDDGPGISEAQRASIFENGVSYRNGGSGHGLSLVRSIVEEEMNGTLRLRSASDATGACFELELPTEEETK